MSKKDFIQTYTGLKFYVENPEPAQISYMDIAHALSNNCRFTGHVISFYSVAQHSVSVCDLLKENGYDDNLQLQGLLHDASEAYLVDLATPIKKNMPEYKILETRVQSAICEKFGIPTQLDPLVKQADTFALMWEARDLLGPLSKEGWPTLNADQKKYLDSRPVITPWLPERARMEFVARLARLS